MQSRIGIVALLFAALIAAGCMGVESDEERRVSFVAAHPELDERTKEAVLEGVIYRGMPAAAAEASWGKPSRSNRSVGSWGVNEQWVYSSSSGLAYAYVYIENGFVSSWQVMR